MSVAPDGVLQPGSVSQDLLFGKSSGTVALPPIPEYVYPRVSALTSHMPSCLSTLKTSKRQNSRFSDRAPRRSRNQPACASNELQKTRQSTIGRSDNAVITCSRDNAWGVAHEVETVPTIAFEKNTGETSGGRLVLRQENALMVPNSRACSRGGSALRVISGSLASGENISSRTASVRSNTGETPGSKPLQRQENALMVPNPRARSRGGSAPRDSSGSLASGEKISPRIVPVRSNTGETPGSRPLQRQEDALMVPNSRARSRGEALPETALGAWRVEKISPRIASVRSNTGETPGSRPLQCQENALMVPNPRTRSRGGSAPRDRSGSLASGETISSRIVPVRSNTGETPGSRPLQRQEGALMVPNSRACSRGGSAPRDSSGSLASGENISSRIASVRSNTGGTPGSRPLQRQEGALIVPNPRARSRGGSAPRDSSGSLASGEKIFPRIASVRSNTGETPGSRPLQRQEDALMVPNPRACSWGGSAPRVVSGSLASGKRFPLE